jgi:riboflavin kinase, archaea type
LNTVTFEGKVFTGEGNGKKYLALPWVQRQVKEKLGFKPFLGTLNLKLTRESSLRRKLLEKNESPTICPAEGYCVGVLLKATVDAMECAVIIPKVKNYPENVLEIIAPVNLREKLKVKDDDEVAVTVYI